MIQAAQHQITELKEKMRIVCNEVEILRTEATSKDIELAVHFH